MAKVVFVPRTLAATFKVFSLYQLGSMHLQDYYLIYLNLYNLTCYNILFIYGYLMGKIVIYTV